ncbi:hypothetical protein [Chryseobacterium sp. ERMR1:04]|uniref:hypothetical protein n=1 Tax=Chryseobacterium sp. ERMR1:04 TaxID=1705393 RepID=UPI0006C896C6|nr:hypothetical protein [Chryseobacterium sp. ERMR1:04]KPH13594.1 hypothetical protein AMQ68_08525 [Chryseobacterium sp. ERMR1:04]
MAKANLNVLIYLNGLKPVSIDESHQLYIFPEVEIKDQNPSPDWRGILFGCGGAKRSRNQKDIAESGIKLLKNKKPLISERFVILFI